MDIQGTGNIGRPDPIRPNHLNGHRFKVPAGNKIDRPDRVEISHLARFKALLKEVPEVRFEKIEAIRVQIDAGTYETPEKIAGAVEKLLEDLES